VAGIFKKARAAFFEKKQQKTSDFWGYFGMKMPRSRE
jgi:hypothetical protein